MIVLAIYRPPLSKVDWFDTLAELIAEASALGSVVLLGDLNADVLKPAEHSGKALLTVLKAGNHSIPDNIQPTRVSKTTRTALDIIAVDNDLAVVSYSTLDNHINDHFPLSAAIQSVLSKSHTQPIRVRSFKKVNKEEMSQRKRLLLNGIKV